MEIIKKLAPSGFEPLSKPFILFRETKGLYPNVAFLSPLDDGAVNYTYALRC